MIEKLLKIIIIHRILEIAKTNNLLPEIQMGVRRDKLIESILYLLTKQIYIIWNLLGKR